MQFNSIGSSSNFARAGKAAANEMVAAFAASRRASPDYGKMVQKAANIRTEEKLNAWKAESEVAQAGIRAQTKVKKTKIDVDADKAVRKSKRFAGAVAAGGQMISQAGSYYADSKDRKKRDVYQGRDLSRYDTDITSNTNALNQIDNNINPETGTTYGSDSSSSSTSSPPSNDGGNSGKGTSPVVPATGGNVSSDISAQHSAGKGALSKQQIRQFAIDAGFGDQAANTVVGIAGGESGFDPTNSTQRSGLMARTGEDSVGLMQINWGYHKDSGWLQKLGINKREDLFDPAKNLKAAKYLYDGRGGGFQDWTVFNKGIYKDYL